MTAVMKKKLFREFVFSAVAAQPAASERGSLSARGGTPRIGWEAARDELAVQIH